MGKCPRACGAKEQGRQRTSEWDPGVAPVLAGVAPHVLNWVGSSVELKDYVPYRADLAYGFRSVMRAAEEPLHVYS